MKFSGGLSRIIVHTIARFSPQSNHVSSSTCIRSFVTQSDYKPRRRSPSTIDLCHRIWQIKDQQASITPILDQWVQQVGSVGLSETLFVVKELRYCRRYSQALEFSEWLTNRRYYRLSSTTVAIRLDLILKVHGIQQVEDYFNNVSTSLKDHRVYGSLLHCYVSTASVEKAEILFNRMRDLGFVRTTHDFTPMIVLYCKTGNTEKADALMQEMDEKGICYDRFTYTVRLSAYASVSDIEGMEKTLTRMESDPNCVLDWEPYNTVASGYRKAGLPDKALEMLKKSEGLIGRRGRRSTVKGYSFLMTQYGVLGKKDEVLRIWDLFRKEGKFSKLVFSSFLQSMLRIGDLENAEKVFEEWESQDLVNDIYMPNILIAAYSRKGLSEKIEAVLNRAVSRGSKPNNMTWYYLSTAYVRNDQPIQAAEAMKKAALNNGSGPFKPSIMSLAIPLEDFKSNGDLEKAASFLKLLKDNCIICSDVEDRLLNHIRCGNSRSDELDALCSLPDSLLVGD